MCDVTRKLTINELKDLAVTYRKHRRQALLDKRFEDAERFTNVYYRVYKELKRRGRVL